MPRYMIRFNKKDTIIVANNSADAKRIYTLQFFKSKDIQIFNLDFVPSKSRFVEPIVRMKNRKSKPAGNKCTKTSIDIPGRIVKRRKDITQLLSARNPNQVEYIGTKQYNKNK